MYDHRIPDPESQRGGELSNQELFGIGVCMSNHMENDKDNWIDRPR